MALADGAELTILAPGIREFGEDRAIDALIRTQNRASKFEDDILVRGLAGLLELTRESISIENETAEIAHHRGNGAFAATDSAGQADAEHQDPAGDAADCELCEAEAARRIRAASTVLCMSMAMVRGPTPPGTGVMAPATLAASG